MIPLIGIGTYHLQNYDIIKQGYQLGYKHIDTAQLYKNENMIGEIIKDFRQDIFLTTKLHWKYKKEEDIIKSIELSFKNLQTDYIDLFLLHNPTKYKITQYKCLEQFINSYTNKIKNIGLSNFEINDIKDILHNCKIRPICNQIEITPFCNKTELINFCLNENIEIVAHSSLSDKLFFENNLVKELSEKYKKNPSQILLKWSLQNNFKIIPKTNNIEHLKENINLDFMISDFDIIKLNSLNKINFTKFK
jgi:diketogulonate reductase-like aldo/keto reductase